FGDFDTRLCFVGHSHWPAAWSLGSSGPDYEPGLAGEEARVRLEDGRRYLINVGSVGQPRDRDPRAAYGLWDRDERTVTIRRVAYDLQGAAQKILRAGLPRALAERARLRVCLLVASGVFGALAFPGADWSLFAWIWLVPALCCGLVRTPR